METPKTNNGLLRKYSAVDMIRFRRWSNEPAQKKKKPIALLREYNTLHPELSSKQQLINIAVRLKIDGLHKALTGKSLPQKKSKSKLK